MTRSTILKSMLTAAMVACSVNAVQAAPQSVAIPAYFYPVFPDPLWTQMQNSTPTVSFAVMNPANGAGPMPDSNYVSQIAAARAAGVKILGYVYSSYAARDPALQKADIDNYYAWYNVDGIFIDEANSDCLYAPYYADLDAYTKAKGGLGLTVINPGIAVAECFAATADIILNFEGSYTQYLAWNPFGWEAGYDASRFWHLVYATSAADMPSAVLISQANNAGYVYVTPDVLAPNPWDSLPTEPYWSTELAYVQPVDGACSAPVLKPKLSVKGVDTPGGDDRLMFAGSFTLPGIPAIDPVADGLRIVIGDASGAAADITLPGGAYASDIGWIASNNGKWTFRNDTLAPADGISRVSIKTKSDGVSTIVKFKVTGIDGTYTVSPTELPLAGALLLLPDEPTTNCANATFPGPKPTCKVPTNGRIIRCQ